MRTALFPFARLHPLPTARPQAAKRPVVIVHGFLGHPDFLRPLARHLLERGWPRVERVGYPPVGVDLDDIVARIAAAADRVGGPIDVVGHSLGGVACRAWIKCAGGDRVARRFVAMGAPFGGTSLYRLVPGSLRAALDPRGSWVERLGDGPEPVPTTVIRARYDHQVLPAARGSIPGARELVVDGLGHNGLLWSHAVHEAVARALAEPLADDGPEAIALGA